MVSAVPAPAPAPEAAGAAAAPAPTPLAERAPSYQTTKTRIQTGTSSSATTMYPWLDGPSQITVIDRSTVTTYEPGPVTALPEATVLETEVHTHRVTSYVARRAGVSTGSSTAIYTLTRTWVVHAPGAGGDAGPDLPPGSGSASQALPCAQCPSAEQERQRASTRDARCDAHGLETACQGQCELRPAGDENGGRSSLWWCYRLETWEYIYPDLRMGRACWGAKGGNEFLQLNEPCRAGDYRVGCVPCRGAAINWNGANWIDP